jgi:lambda family phage portal protein
MFGFGKKRDLYDELYGKSSPRAPVSPARSGEPFAPSRTLNVGSLPSYRWGYDHGEKYAGGLGPIDILYKDYWALRERSADLFERNVYGRGIIRRLVTNVINSGLHLEATPEERILGLKEDDLAEWSEDVENRFKLWADNGYQCDFNEQQTFGALQAEAYREALVSGDVLVTIQQDPRTRIPRVRLVSGSSVQTPMLSTGKAPNGNEICHGVEIDARGRHVAFWVLQGDRTSQRIPAYGEKSGRRIAWLVYGTDKRIDDVRGTPLLALVLQGLKEIDRYRDAQLRKAVLNAMIAIWVEKSEERMSSRSLTLGADSTYQEPTIDNHGAEKKVRKAELTPGVMFEDLAYGEKMQTFAANQAVEGFGIFEQAVIASVAWANEIPPEILTLSFDSNYSASQAALSEFKMFLTPVRMRFGDTFCSPIYEDWLLSQIYLNRIKAQGFIEAYNDNAQDDTYGAWVSSDWSGHVKPAIDMLKTTRAYTEQVEQGFITRDRAAREINGTKFSKNVQKMKRESEQLAEAMRPLLEMEALLKASSQPLPSDAPEEPADQKKNGRAA